MFCKIGVWLFHMLNPILFSHPTSSSLAGHLLVATSQIQGEFFERSVIYIAAHNTQGAMGLIVNSPIDRVSLNEILAQMNVDAMAGDRSLPIMFGGPVESHRGFVIYTGEAMAQSALSSYDGINVSANAALLKAWVDGAVSAKAMLALGYSGWSPGQLEREIENGSWVVIPATETLMFDTHHENKWNLAVASLGFDLGNLYATAGHA